MTAINELLCWDQLYAIGGALRHIEFRPALGCFTSATHPASVSTAPVQAMEISLYPAYNTISKMLSCDPELKKDVMTIGGTSQFPLTVFRGIDQWGEKFGYLLLDPMVGAIGAFSFRDGIATGGQVRSPICRIGNVEHNEQSFPLLIIHRKENTDSGGAGKYRGGNSASVAFIPHGTTHIIQDTESSGAAIRRRRGWRVVSGEYELLLVCDTDILQRCAAADAERHRGGGGARGVAAAAADRYLPGAE
jgi:N-methylhydantoinase B